LEIKAPNPVIFFNFIICFSDFRLRGVERRRRSSDFVRHHGARGEGLGAHPEGVRARKRKHQERTDGRQDEVLLGGNVGSRASGSPGNHSDNFIS